MTNKITTHVKGFITSDFVFLNLSKLFKCRVLPKSIGGRNLLSKIYENFSALLEENECELSNTYQLNTLNGTLVLLLRGHDDIYTYCVSQRHYPLIIILIATIEYAKSENICYVEPLESHTIISAVDVVPLFNETDYILEVDSEIPFYTFNEYITENIINCTDLFGNTKSNKTDSFILNIWGTFTHNHTSYNLSEDLNALFLNHYTIKCTDDIINYFKLDEDSDSQDCDEIGVKECNGDVKSNRSYYTGGVPSNHRDCPENQLRGMVNDILKECTSVFLHTNGSYFTDGLWVLNNNNTCSTANDVLLLLKSSPCWNGEDLVLFDGENFDSFIKLRLFTYNNEIIVITQLFMNEVYDYLIKDLDRLNRGINTFFIEKVINKVKPNIVADLYINSNDYGNIQILDIKPWHFHELTLFDWTNIYELATTGKKFDTSHISVGNVTYVLLTSNDLFKLG